MGFVDGKTKKKFWSYSFAGADTPFYLATLPENATEPNGQFISERKLADVDAEVKF